MASPLSIGGLRGGDQKHIGTEIEAVSIYWRALPHLQSSPSHGLFVLSRAGSHRAPLPGTVHFGLSRSRVGMKQIRTLTVQPLIGNISSSVPWNLTCPTHGSRWDTCLERGPKETGESSSPMNPRRGPLYHFRRSSSGQPLFALGPLINPVLCF